MWEEIEGANPVDIQQPSSCGPGFSVRRNMMRAHIVEKGTTAAVQPPQQDAMTEEAASFRPGWVCLKADIDTLTWNLSIHGEWKELICKAGNCGHCHQCNDGILPSEALKKKQENDYLLSPEGRSRMRSNHHPSPDLDANSIL